MSPIYLIPSNDNQPYILHFPSQLLIIFTKYICVLKKKKQLLESVNDDQVTYYANGNHDLQPSKEPSRLLNLEQSVPNPPPPSIHKVDNVSCLPLLLLPPTPTSQETSTFAYSANYQVS